MERTLKGLYTPEFWAEVVKLVEVTGMCGDSTKPILASIERFCLRISSSRHEHLKV